MRACTTYLAAVVLHMINASVDTYDVPVHGGESGAHAQPTASLRSDQCRERVVDHLELVAPRQNVHYRLFDSGTHIG